MIFAVTHLGGVIGLIWLSMVMITIARFFTFHRFYNDFIEFLASDNAAQMGPALLMMLGYLVAALLLYAVMFVAVVQLALGARAAPAVDPFRLRARWNGACSAPSSAFAGLMLLITMAIMFAVNAGIAVVPARDKPDQAAVSTVMMLAMFGIGLLLTARFLLLLPAIAVSETAPVLRRAWALSAGNFWRCWACCWRLFLPLLLCFHPVWNWDWRRKAPAPCRARTPQLQVIAAIMHARQTLPLTCGLELFLLAAGGRPVRRRQRFGLADAQGRAGRWISRRDAPRPDYSAAFSLLGAGAFFSSGLRYWPV